MVIWSYSSPIINYSKGSSFRSISTLSKVLKLLKGVLTQNGCLCNFTH